MKRGILLSIMLLAANILLAQSSLKKAIGPSELGLLQITFEQLAKTDQLYRKFIANETLDSSVVRQIDSVFNSQGIESGMHYKKALGLELSKSQKDSLWELQHSADFINHQILRGILETYGWIPDSVIEEKNYVQMILLMHPPKDWDIPTYLTDYGLLLKEEVKAGRMPALSYATFYDNIKGKILREPQLYGTNEQFDPTSGKVLPPNIADLEMSNKARKEIGLPPLQPGEYRLARE